MTEQDKIRYLHFRRPSKDGGYEAKGGVTVAYQIIGAEQINYASAKCAKTDIYSKHLGRVKAAGRLNSITHVAGFYGTEREFIEASTGELGRRNRYVRKYNGVRKKTRAICGNDLSRTDTGSGLIGN